MSQFWQAFKAEVRKQHHDSFGSRAVFFSLLFWPVLGFLSSYYAMKPYRIGKGSVLSHVIPGGNIVLFLLSGFLVFQLFWTVVQSAWTFAQERQMGTLEIIFLTPASKMAFLLGRSAYGLFSGMWMFAAFSTLTFIFIANLAHIAPGYLLLSILLSLFSALVWGAFLSAISLFSRDSGFVYYAFGEPMNLFGGVRIPPSVFPIWAKGLALLFPVTYSLFLIRSAINGTITANWWIVMAALLLINAGLIWGTKLLLKRAEQYARKQGNWTMF
ncbi:ABC transporter permease [Alicyclobacillus sp. SO9]|uniref:ABC transporter permease n=1 Tax=Alicyclobacillus sp. SO9 TaxID=2665646 RepID=UPI0018E776C5|nr:ABC transporter permease [Alicyclobacillus sp. SO9]QQE77109.1 ABC transporter permease [Alicyclobacillus sp. SO9]